MSNEKEMILCKKCNKLRMNYKGSNGLCQICYREVLEEYSYFDYKTPKEKLSGNSLKICELLIEQGLDVNAIYKELGLNKVYVRQVINKHTNRVNANGHIRPNY